MSEEGGFDPCECIWGHELAMRRLLNVLRNSQAVCTDSECYVDDATPQQSSSQPDQILLLSIIFVICLVMHYFRPRLENSSKPGSSGNYPRNPPPATS